MVGIAQLVRVSGCGPEGRGFKSHCPPQEFFEEIDYLFHLIKQFLIMAPSSNG